MVSIELVEMKESDLDFFLEVRNSCSEKFLHDSRKFSSEDAKRWYTEKSPLFYIIKYEGERIGYFRTSNLDQKNRSIYIGCDIHENFRGKGLAFKSYLLFIPLITKKFSLDIILLEVLSTNFVAMSLYKKLGFLEKETKKEEVLKGDSLVDSIVMYINSKDFCYEG